MNGSTVKLFLNNRVGKFGLAISQERARIAKYLVSDVIYALSHALSLYIENMRNTKKPHGQLAGAERNQRSGLANTLAKFGKTFEMNSQYSIDDEPH